MSLPMSWFAPWYVHLLEAGWAYKFKNLYMKMPLKKDNQNPVISRTYSLSNKTISRPPQSRETIPLRVMFEIQDNGQGPVVGK
jgi:hypothetical protein